MVVSLHSLSTENRDVEKVVEKQERFETDEKIEIACVGRLLGEARDTRRVKKVKRNKQFLQ